MCYKLNKKVRNVLNEFGKIYQDNAVEMRDRDD